jgi:hypothetical protein
MRTCVCVCVCVCLVVRGDAFAAGGPDDDEGFLLLGLSESDAASAASDPVFLPADDIHLGAASSAE